MKAKYMTALLSGLFLSLGVTSASADEVSFAGERVDVIIPFAEGGGSTVYVRFLEPFLNKYMPGEPTLVVRNVPGGGSVRGINQFARTAKPDGLTIANTGSGTVLATVLGDSSVQYELKDFIPVISSPFGVLVYGREDLGVTVDNLEDLKGKKLSYGDRSPADGGMPIILALELLDLDVQYIWGLEGGDRRQAFMRGETNLTFDNMSAYADRVVPMIEDGEAQPLFTLGFLDENGDIVRDPMLPEVPTFFEVYERIHGKPLDGPQLGAMKALFMGRVMAAKMMILPKDTPPEIVAAYDEVFAKIASDPDFTGGPGEEIVGPYPQSLGDQARRVLKEAADVDEDAREWLRNWLRERFDVAI